MCYFRFLVELRPSFLSDCVGAIAVAAAIIDDCWSNKTVFLAIAFAPLRFLTAELVNSFEIGDCGETIYASGGCGCCYCLDYPTMSYLARSSYFFRCRKSALFWEEDAAAAYYSVVGATMAVVVVLEASMLLCNSFIC